MLTREDILTFLRDNKSYLHEHYKVIEIGIFGSFARGEATEQSDIDVLVNFEPDTRGLFELKWDLREYLSAHFNRKVDIARPGFLKERAKATILNDAIYV